MDQAFASLDYHFSPPPTEFQAMEVDSSVMESIFNPEATEEEIQRQIAAMQAQARSTSRSRSAGSSRGSSASRGSASQEQQVYDVDMSASSGTDHHLTQNEIVSVVTADFAALRECIMQEVQADSSFRGVTVKFFINPSGTTGGVELKEARYENRPVGQCLIDRFRSMRFPEHGAITPRGVEYPLYVQ